MYVTAGLCNAALTCIKKIRKYVKELKKLIFNFKGSECSEFSTRGKQRDLHNTL